MNFKPILISVLLSTAACIQGDGPADNQIDKVRPVPPPGIVIADADRASLQSGTEELGRRIEALRGDLKEKPRLLALLPDVQIFHNAVHYALTHGEFFKTNETVAARELLQHGHTRAQALMDGVAPWINATGLVVRGYVSRIDGSVQPYGLVAPPSFSPASAHRFRLDAWFHGRDERLSELAFLNQRMRSPGEFTPPNAFVLHLYGRYCNANKFAGEIDLFEALENVRANYPIDENRLVVRGFSMGGAACWQFAVHYAGLWAAAAPGAGFSETAEFLNVFQNEKVQPAWWEKKLWHLYDCTDYALNLFNCPTVAYSGEIDRQKQAADIMARALAAEGLTLTHVIGPQTAHKYHPDSKIEINRRIDAIVARGRDPLPREVKFTTWTLRYNRMNWVVVDHLDHHWERARVDAELVGDSAVRVTTKNVAALTLDMPSGHCPLNMTKPVQVTLDGQELTASAPQTDRSWTARFHRKGGRWENGAIAEGGLKKKHGLQGPIDDAFMDSFLIVRPTGQPMNSRLGAWTAGEQAHAIEHWRRQFRGEPRVKDDRDVSDADIARHHLILFGDPSSNSLIAKMAAQTPFRWNAQGVHTGDAIFPADKYAPVLIYPNPLNPERYVVWNSGFTFREYDYLNNARQIPKLPDFAIIDLSVPVSSRAPGGIATAGFFDESWQLPKR